jgi:hypothetical protein
VALDEALLKTTLERIHARPTVDEAIAVFDVARLAASADGRSDVGETYLLVMLRQIRGAMAGEEELPFSAAKVDQRRLFQLGELLGPASARELAFACGYLVMAQDREVTPEESKLATSLGAALVLDPERIAQLSSEMDALARTFRT